MLNYFVKKINNKKGFTLVELVVVIAILGILAAIAVPRFANSQKNAAVSAHNANVRTLEGAANMFIAEGNLNFNWDNTSGKEDWTEYLQSWPVLPKEIAVLEAEDKRTYEADVDNGVIKVTPGLKKLNGANIVDVTP